MKISIICITANPTEKQYAWKEALASYCDFADEVIIVDGGTEEIVFPNPKVRVVHVPDPTVWNWAEHAKRLNRGLDEATGDWIFKTDIDWLFHEESFLDIRKRLVTLSSYPTVTMQKMTYYPSRRYIQKGQVPMIINGAMKGGVRFGKDLGKYTDLTYPILWDRTSVDEHDVPVGKLLTQKEWERTGISFWNFDYTFKTIDVAKYMFLRGSLAHQEYFGHSGWGKTEEEAFNHFMENMRGKQSRGLDIIDLAMIPKYIRQRIRELKPEEFGYNGWGMLA